MFAGKSNQLLFLLERLKYAKIPYIVFRPNIDRYKDSLGTRFSDRREPSISIDINNPKEIYKHIDLDNLKLPLTVVVDEAQFFENSFLDVVRDLNRKGVRFIIGGLDVDACNRPFGVMPQLLSLASKVIKLKAVCAFCKGDAWKTTLKKADPGMKDKSIKLDEEDFIPVCSACFYENKKKLEA
nr:thymidine kinase [Candidatus Mycoplasma haemohominis]